MSFFTNTRLQRLLFFLLPLLLYANTLGHGFVLDDVVTISENRFVQAGWSGVPDIFSTDEFAGYLPEAAASHPVAGGRYRPVSLLCFATLAQFFGLNSWVFHLFAVLLYACSCALLYRVLWLLLKPLQSDAFTALTAWGTTLLFTVHPVHTEAVANVKGCDEQLALLAGLGLLYAALRYWDTAQWKWAAVAGGLFLAGCLAKENAATFLLLAPLALWFFRGGTAAAFTGRQGLRLYIPLFLALGLVIVLRGMALDWHFSAGPGNEPLNNPFLKSDGTQWVPFSAAEKAATILYTLFQYARLLLWPHPLTHDYYPFQIAPQSFDRPAVLAGLALYALLLGAAVWGLLKRKPLVFGLWAYLLPLAVVANIVLPVGTFMAERFLFLPSVGYCLALAWVWARAAERLNLQPWPAAVPLLLVAVLFGGMTVLRNRAWSDNKKLLQTDLPTSPRSAKLHQMLGATLLSEAMAANTDSTRRLRLLHEADGHFKRALDLHPSYYEAILLFASCSFYLQEYDRAILAYRHIARMNPTDSLAVPRLVDALRQGGVFYTRTRPDPNKAVAYLSEAWQLQPDTATAVLLAGQYTAAGQATEAVSWLEKALALAPDDAALRRQLRNAYLSAGETAKAAALEKSPQSPATFTTGSR